jgi:hypothetical protein
MTSRDLEKLKQKLPKGYRMMIWKKLCNVSLSAIDKVLRGDYNNEAILNTAIELAEEHQATIKNLKDKISSL